MKILHTKNASDRRAVRRRTIAALLASLTLTFTAPSWAAVAVVVSANSDLSTISQTAIKNIFLGKKKALPNGATAAPVNHSDKSPIYDEFNEKVLQRPSDKVLQYWTRKVFSGKGKPPPAVDSDQAVIDHVTGTPGGIGYIDPASANGRVKILLKVN